MTAAWLQQTPERQRELLGLVSSKTGMTANAIEKDWWVTLALYAVFQTEWAKHLVFKGGTSLSKSWGLIERFSEDIDLVLDRSVLGFGEELSKNKVKQLRKASCTFTSGPFRIAINDQLLKLGVPENQFTLIPKDVGDSDTDPQVLKLNYASVLERSTYLKESVLIEVGARSLREPSEQREISSFISQQLKTDIAGKPFSILTVTPTRTFLEKMFLLHEEFGKPTGQIRNDRMSRHLYDIERIMDTSYGLEALEDRDLYNGIVSHREKFNALRGIDYKTHYPQTINFVPPDAVIKSWETDYKIMQENMIYGHSISFTKLMFRITELLERIRKCEIR